MTTEQNTKRKTIVIDGNNFSDLQGFYNEIDRVLANGHPWKTNNNLVSLNALLAGGFGALQSREPSTIIWVNAGKSKTDFNRMNNGAALYNTIIEIIKSHRHIELVED